MFPDLRLIRLSSGQVSKADVDLFQQRFPNCVLLHVLSSTEAITYCAHFVDAHYVLGDDTLPVGYPVEDMEVMILDENHDSAPLGTMGEIAIRSAFLFPGYWKNSALTDRSFAAGSAATGRRTFLTGDLGRLRADGCLEYCGRTDFRVKIRGHSVHLEEVELALGKIDDVKEAVAAAKPDLHGDNRLVAYIVPRAHGDLHADVLRNGLKSFLPDYMIPSTFVFCAALPKLPNDKVDRQALPLPDETRPNLATPYAAPATTLAAEIGRIWSEVLGIKPIGLHDNFFDLGGDSLLGSRIAAAIANAYGCDFSLADLFQCATVEAIAEALTARGPNCFSQDSATQSFGN
jgi:acyl-coenzyme A synthetase/AMP-(fatty) acid ligase/acyl carrier protein